MSGPQKQQVTVVGSFMMDVVVRTSKRPGGRRDRDRQLRRLLPRRQGLQPSGGRACVTARRRRWSAASAPTAFGDQFVAALKREGIGAKHVGRDEHVGTGVGLPIVDDSGANSIIVVPQANLQCNPAPHRGGGGGHPDRLGRPGAARVAVRVGRRGVADRPQRGRAHDPQPGADGTTVARRLQGTGRPCHAERGRSRGHRAWCRQRSRRRSPLRSRRRSTAPAVLLTLGEKGALLWEAGTATRFDAHNVTVVDTVGAGDATCGALAAAWASGATLAEAARVGNAAGALAVTVAGAEPRCRAAANRRGCWGQVTQRIQLPDDRVVDQRSGRRRRHRRPASCRGAWRARTATSSRWRSSSWRRRRVACG